MVSGILWKANVKSKSAEEGCQVFKDSILQAQESYTLANE